MTTQSLPLGILHAAEQQALQQTLSNHPSKCGFQHTNCLQLASTTFTEEFTQIWPNLLKCSSSSDHSMKKTCRREEEYIDAPITNWLTDAKISLSLSHTHTHTHTCVCAFCLPSRPQRGSKQAGLWHIITLHQQLHLKLQRDCLYTEHLSLWPALYPLKAMDCNFPHLHDAFVKNRWP
jgi:hypothetical protein